jgi:drug/metabolite transporter (DMT)-like permease
MRTPKPRTGKSDEQKGIFIGFIASLTFATYVLINRYVYLNYSVEVLNYVATFRAAGGIFALLGLAASYFRGAVRFLHRDTLPVVGNAVIALAGLSLFVFGQRYTTAVNASLATTATVITTALFSRLVLKESFTRKQQLWLAVMFAGLYLAVVGRHIVSINKGDAIVMAAAVLLGFANAITKILVKKSPSNFVADMRLATGGLLTFLLALIFIGSDFLVVSAGLWPLMAGFFFWVTIKSFYAAVHYIGPNKAIVLGNCHPFFTALVGVFLLAEPYSMVKFIGSVVVLVSVYFISKKEPQPLPV